MSYVQHITKNKEKTWFTINSHVLSVISVRDLSETQLFFRHRVLYGFSYDTYGCYSHV